MCHRNTVFYFYYCQWRVSLLISWFGFLCILTSSLTEDEDIMSSLSNYSVMSHMSWWYFSIMPQSLYYTIETENFHKFYVRLAFSTLFFTSKPSTGTPTLLGCLYSIVAFASTILFSLKKRHIFHSLRTEIPRFNWFFISSHFHIRNKSTQARCGETKMNRRPAILVVSIF